MFMLILIAWVLCPHGFIKKNVRTAVKYLKLLTETYCSKNVQCSHHASAFMGRAFWMKRCFIHYTLDSDRAERVEEGLFSELQTAVKRENDHRHWRSGKTADSIQQTLTRCSFCLQIKAKSRGMSNVREDTFCWLTARANNQSVQIVFVKI